MELIGIKWAPWNVPIERRIQTAMAFLWIISLAFGGFICTFFLLYVLFFTNYYILGLLYIAWVYYDRETAFRGGRRSHWFRNLLCWKYFVEYFPLKLEKTAELPLNRNYIFGVFPHGLLSAGAFGNFGTDRTQTKTLFPGLKMHNATLDMHFNTPFFREYLLSVGAVSASRESLTYILGRERRGEVVILVVGGAAESLYAHPGIYRLVIKNRKGFVRIALKTGSSLVPVFSFGENDLFDQVSNPPGSKLLKFQNWLRKYIGIAPCLFFGRGVLQYSLGPLPNRRPVTTVVGKPIDVPRVEHPTQEQIDEYHEKFLNALCSLFNEHKHKYIENPDKTELIIE